MKMENYQKLRLTEFNSFDIERLIKDNAEILNEENANANKFLQEEAEMIPEDMAFEMIEQIEDYAAEALYTLSILHHTDDIYGFFTAGPLFRKDRNA